MTNDKWCAMATTTKATTFALTTAPAMTSSMTATTTGTTMTDNNVNDVLDDIKVVEQKIHEPANNDTVMRHASCVMRHAMTHVERTTPMKKRRHQEHDGIAVPSSSSHRGRTETSRPKRQVHLKDRVYLSEDSINHDKNKAHIKQKHL